MYRKMSAKEKISIDTHPLTLLRPLSSGEKGPFEAGRGGIFGEKAIKDKFFSPAYVAIFRVDYFIARLCSRLSGLIEQFNLFRYSEHG